MEDDTKLTLSNIGRAITEALSDIGRAMENFNQWVLNVDLTILLTLGMVAVVCWFLWEIVKFVWLLIPDSVKNPIIKTASFLWKSLKYTTYFFYILMFVFIVFILIFESSWRSSS
jgi:hypothetical protein